MIRLRPLLLALGLPATALAEPPEPTVVPTLQVQTWVTVFDQDENPQADPAGYGDPEHDPGFAIPRARAGLAGSYGLADYEIIFGTSSPYDRLSPSNIDVGLVSALARGNFEVGPGALRVSAGFQRVPFGREQQISSRDLLFQERAVSTEWTSPSYDAGAVVDYELDLGVRARAGVFNGNGSLLGDDNAGVLGSLRLEYGKGETYDTSGREKALGFGVSGLVNSDVATRTLAAGADALLRVGPVSLLAEGTLAELSPGDTTIDRPDVAAPTRRLGALAQLSWTQPIGDSDLEIGGRFSLFDDATKASDNGDVGILHAGVTWWNAWNGLDVGAGFIHREELGGRALPNDTARLWIQADWPPELAERAVTPP